MSEFAVFTAALGLHAPWSVTDIRFDEGAKRIDFDIGYRRGARFACPGCDTPDQAVHDRRERSWQHLHFFQHRAFIHAQLPRVRCAGCGKTTQVPVPWARAGSGFSLLFEALVVTLCKHMPVNTVATHLGVSDDALWRVLAYYTEAAREQEDFSAVKAVGIEETASKRGQHYITLFHDLEAKRLLFACPGANQAAIRSFGQDLRQHGGEPDRIDNVCIDMSKAFITGVAKHLPQATVTFDGFHIIQLANKAMDEVRREEVRYQPLLKRTRWIWLKDSNKWSAKQLKKFEALAAKKVKSARAWALKESLREILSARLTREQATQQLKRWYHRARCSRLEPIKRFALTIKAHWEGILNGFDSRLSNGRAEGINSMIQAAKARARGYRTPANFITIAYLLAGKFRRMPHSPYNTTSCGQT
jgi:transposase